MGWLGGSFVVASWIACETHGNSQGFWRRNRGFDELCCWETEGGLKKKTNKQKKQKNMREESKREEKERRTKNEIEEGTHPKQLNHTHKFPPLLKKILTEKRREKKKEIEAKKGEGGVVGDEQFEQKKQKKYERGEQKRGRKGELKTNNNYGTHTYHPSKVSFCSSLTYKKIRERSIPIDLSSLINNLNFPRLR